VQGGEQNQQRRGAAHLIQLDNAGSATSQAASGDVPAMVFRTRWPTPSLEKVTVQPANVLLSQRLPAALALL